MTIQERIGGVIRIASRLIDVLDAEVAALREMRMDAVAAIQPEKTALVAEYEAEIAGLTGQRDALVLLAPALQAEFRRVAKGLAAASVSNAAALTAAREAHDRVLRSIVEAAGAAAKPTATYSRAGRIGEVKRNQPPSRLSLTLDRRL